VNLIVSHELLVPVGNFESLVEAINNGADAVYLGGKRFGARAFADNFTLEELSDAVKLCHLYGVKIYVTVNTLIYEREIDDALNYCRDLHKMGVDALIMQDVGLINLVHQILPNLEIHASTQMHNHSKESLKFLEKLGIKRVVFARELPLKYINDIDTPLEKEIFMHGSLCVSYSGQCLFSSCILGRSGNRGECAGICRLPYKIYENDKEIHTDGDYILSPKDISSLDNFRELMDSNIKCFKIEGRMKSPAYVGVVTKIYRTLMDQYDRGEELKVNEDDFLLLKAIFNREYTSSYLFNNSKIMNFKAPNNLGIGIGNVTNVTTKKIEIQLFHDLKQFEGIRFKHSNLGMTINFMYDKKDNLINKGVKGDTIYLDNFINLKEKDEVMLTSPVVNVCNVVTKKIVVNVKLEAFLGSTLKIEVTDSENTIAIDGNVVDEAKSSPITYERIEEVLRKSGNTPFEVNSIDIKMDNNIFIPIGKLNEIRRKALEELKVLRENKKVLYREEEYEDNKKPMKITNGISVLVRTKEQIQACLDLNVENIIVNNKELMADNFIFRVPRDNMYHNYKYKKLMVTDYASLDKYPNNRADYFLNITNHYSLDYVSNYADVVTLSVECNLDDIKDIISSYQRKVNVEVLVYGNIELMLMKYCPLNTIINKDKVCSVCKNNNKYYLKDRNNKYYRLENNSITHSTTILNCNKTNLIDKIKDLKELGVTNYRVEFLEENYEEAKEIIERVKRYYE